MSRWAVIPIGSIIDRWRFADGGDIAGPTRRSEQAWHADRGGQPRPRRDNRAKSESCGVVSTFVSTRSESGVFAGFSCVFRATHNPLVGGSSPSGPIPTCAASADSVVFSKIAKIAAASCESVRTTPLEFTCVSAFFLSHLPATAIGLVRTGFLVSVGSSGYSAGCVPPLVSSPADDFTVFLT